MEDKDKNENEREKLVAKERAQLLESRERDPQGLTLPRDDAGHIRRAAAAQLEREEQVLVANAQAELDAARRSGRIREVVDDQSERRIATTNPTGYLAVGPAGQLVTLPLSAPLKPSWRWATSRDDGKQDRDRQRRERARRETATPANPVPRSSKE